MAEATAIREKDAQAFAAYKAEADTNIAAMTKALRCYLPLRLLVSDGASASA